MGNKRVTGKNGYRIWLALGNSIFRSYYTGCAQSLDLTGDEKIIDFGCGPGLVSRYLADSVPQGNVTCVDVSEDAIELAKNRLRKYPNTDFILGDIRDAGLPLHSYDIIFLNFVYFHVDESISHAIMKHLKDLLKKNGRMVIRNAVGDKWEISSGQIIKEMKEAGLNEIKSEMTKSLFVVPTYCGVFGKN